MTSTSVSDGQSSDVPGFTHHLSSVNGVRLHAVVGGTGPQVMLIHGWPFTWRVWRPLLAPLAAAGYTVIAPDMRGIGDSEKPVDGYAKADVARDLELLAREFGPGPTHVVGMDIGTMVAFAWAVGAPDTVKTLTLSESVLPGFGLEELMNPATGGFWHFGFHMQVDLAAFLTQDKAAAYLMPTMNMMSRGLSDEDRADIVAHYSAPDGMRGGFAHYGTLLEDGRANAGVAAGQLGMPVLVLNGEQGLPQAPLLGGVEQVARDIHTDIVPDAGHTFATDNADWTSRRLDHFFTTGE